MKEQSSAELLNQWMGNPDYHERWETACQTKLKQLVQQAFSLGAEALSPFEIELSTQRSTKNTVILLSVGDPCTTLVRVISVAGSPPEFEIVAALHQGSGRSSQRTIFTSKEGLSPRSTRATVSQHLEKLEELLVAAAAAAAKAPGK